MQCVGRLVSTSLVLPQYILPFIHPSIHSTDRQATIHHHVFGLEEVEKNIDILQLEQCQQLDYCAALYRKLTFLKWDIELFFFSISLQCTHFLSILLNYCFVIVCTHYFLVRGVIIYYF